MNVHLRMCYLFALNPTSDCAVSSNRIGAEFGRVTARLNQDALFVPYLKPLSSHHVDVGDRPMIQKQVR